MYWESEKILEKGSWRAGQWGGREWGGEVNEMREVERVNCGRAEAVAMGGGRNAGH